MISAIINYDKYYFGRGSCMPEEHVNQDWRQTEFDDAKQTFDDAVHIADREKYELIKKMSGSFSNDLFQQLDLEKHEEKRIAKVRELA